MANTDESGHNKNLISFEIITGTVSSYGLNYNPARANLKIASLNATLSSSKSCLAAFNIAYSNYRNAVDAREVAFTQAGKMITKISNATKASDTSIKTDETIRSMIKLLRGQRLTKEPKIDPDKAEVADESKRISASRMSYDNRVDNLDRLIKLLAGIPTYIPNETELKIPALNAFCADLKAKSAAVMNTYIALRNARIARNDLFYKPGSGIVDLSLDIKSYIKSVFGAESPQYKSISSLRVINYGI